MNGLGMLGLVIIIIGTCIAVGKFVVECRGYREQVKFEKECENEGNNGLLWS